MQHNETQHLEAEGVAVSLTYSELDIVSVVARVKSPKAGAIVLFAGCVSTSYLNQS